MKCQESTCPATNYEALHNRVHQTPAGHRLHHLPSQDLRLPDRPFLNQVNYVLDVPHRQYLRHPYRATMEHHGQSNAEAIRFQFEADCPHQVPLRVPEVFLRRIAPARRLAVHAPYSHFGRQKLLLDVRYVDSSLVASVMKPADDERHFQQHLVQKPILVQARHQHRLLQKTERSLGHWSTNFAEDDTRPLEHVAADSSREPSVPQPAQANQARGRIRRQLRQLCGRPVLFVQVSF